MNKLQKFNPIIRRFMAIVLILNGALLGINWYKKTAADWNNLIIWIAVANVAVGLIVLIAGYKFPRADDVNDVKAKSRFYNHKNKED